MIVLIPYSITAKYSSLTFKSSPWLPSPYTHPGQVLTLQGTAGGVGTQCSNPGSVSNSRVTLGKPFCLSRSSIFFLEMYLFICLAALGLSCCAQDVWPSLQHVSSLSCGIKDLILGPGVEPGVPALGAQSLTHWTTREVPRSSFHTRKTKGLNCIL